MLQLTQKAINKIKDISDAEGIGHFNIRVKIIGSGCAGFTHDMHYEDSPSDLDEKFTFGQVNVIVDPLSYQYLQDVEIDYLDGEFESGFKFNNPSVKSTCGCGSSVNF